MERKQLEQRYEEMVKRTADLLRAEGNRLMAQGAIDIASHPDNYLLPMVILYVALKNISWSFTPRTVEEKKEAAKLRHF